MPKTITLPHRFEPREYQLPFLQAMDEGKKRAVLVWHRRAGKDKTVLNFTIKKMFERIGAYYYFFPEYSQGKKVIWEGIDRDGFKFLDHFPKEIIEDKHGSELKVKLKNGSLFQVIGTNNYDSIMGTNPVGCVFSEYALQNPRAWDYVRPILAENGGWAVFDFTPRGENHAYDLLRATEDDPNWFTQILTVDDTKAISQTAIDDERASGMSEDMIQQEYYCSFQASLQGAYYTEQLKKAKDDGRIARVSHETNIPVDTWWDLGIGDAMAIWFTQRIGREIHVIDYYESDGMGLNDYAKILQEKNYVYGTHNMPHDVKVRELGTGKSRLETAESLGIRPIYVVPNIPVDDGINAVRMIFDRLWFDEEKCKQGLNALRSYQKEYDDKRQMYKPRPLHNWASHGSDAMRYLAVGFRDRIEQKSQRSERMQRRIRDSKFSAVAY